MVDDGTLLVWGSNLFGQLGFQAPIEQLGSPLKGDDAGDGVATLNVGIQAHQLVPRHLPSAELVGRLVVSVACGEHHTVALSGTVEA